MERELGEAISTDDLLLILKNNADKIHGLNLSDGILEAIKRDNWNTAKDLAMVFVLCQRPDWHWDKLMQSEEVKIALAGYEKTIGPFSWLQIFVPRRSSAKEVELAKALLEANKITFWELYETSISGTALTWLELLPIRREESIATTVYKIITNEKMKRQHRIRLMQLLAEKSALSLAPIGPENLSPPLLCIKYGILYLIPFFKNLPGFDKVQSPEGYNFNIHLGLKYQNDFFRMRDFTVEDFKVIITRCQTNATASLMSMNMFSHGTDARPPSNIYQALRELYIERRLDYSIIREPQKLLGPYGARFFYQLGAYFDESSDYRKADAQYKKLIAKQAILAHNKKFNFEELPIEILELIVAKLDILSQQRLFLSSKYFHDVQTKFSRAFYLTQMKDQFQVNFSLLTANEAAQNIDWHQEYNRNCRQYLGYSLHHKEPKQLEYKSTSVFAFYPRIFDDNWLMMDDLSTMALWDSHNHKLFEFGGYNSNPAVNFLESNVGKLPKIVKATKNKLAVMELNCNQTISTKEVATPWEGDSEYVEVVSCNSIIAGKQPVQLHLETGHVMQTIDLSAVKKAVHNKLTRLTLFDSFNGIQFGVVLMDKNFNTIHQYEQKQFITNINWINQELFIVQGHDGFEVFDIRKIDRPMTQFTKSHFGETISVHRGGYHVISSLNELACVWDLSSGSWTRVIHTPYTIMENNSRCSISFKTPPHIRFCALDFKI